MQNLLPSISVPASVLAAAPRSVDPKCLYPEPVGEVWLELGFGGGEHLAAQAERHPSVGLIGCEPFENGVASLLKHIDDRGLRNVRVLPDDGRPLLTALADATIARIFVLFPDPWPKLRHQRRRLVSPAMLDVFARVLIDRGRLRLATDDPTYAAAMHQMLAGHAVFQGGGSSFEKGVRPADAPVSRYETKARRAGREPVFFDLMRRARAAAPQNG